MWGPLYSVWSLSFTAKPEPQPPGASALLGGPLKQKALRFDSKASQLALATHYPDQGYDGSEATLRSAFGLCAVPLGAQTLSPIRTMIAQANTEATAATKPNNATLREFIRTQIEDEPNAAMFHTILKKDQSIELYTVRELIKLAGMERIIDVVDIMNRMPTWGGYNFTHIYLVFGTKVVRFRRYIVKGEDKVLSFRIGNDPYIFAPDGTILPA